MVNQILIAANMIGVCEALLYGYKAGLDLEDGAAVGRSGAAGQLVARESRPADDRRATSIPGFFVEHFIKDMGIALDEARADEPVAARPGAGASSSTSPCRRRATAARARTR